VQACPSLQILAPFGVKQADGTVDKSTEGLLIAPDDLLA
jgi:hypothetical protein